MCRSPCTTGAVQGWGVKCPTSKPDVPGMFSAEREMKSPPSCCACCRFSPEERGVAVPGTPCGSALIRFLVQFTQLFSYSCCSSHFSQLLISHCLFSLSAGPCSIFAFPSLLFVLISMCLTYVFVAVCPIIATTFPCCCSPSLSSDGGSGSSQRWAGNRNVPAIHRCLVRAPWTSPYHKHEHCMAPGSLWVLCRAGCSATPAGAAVLLQVRVEMQTAKPQLQAFVSEPQKGSHKSSIS